MNEIAQASKRKKEDLNLDSLDSETDVLPTTLVCPTNSSVVGRTSPSHWVLSSPISKNQSILVTN